MIIALFLVVLAGKVYMILYILCKLICCWAGLLIIMGINLSFTT